MERLRIHTDFPSASSAVQSSAGRWARGDPSTTEKVGQSVNVHPLVAESMLLWLRYTHGFSSLLSCGFSSLSLSCGFSSLSSLSCGSFQTPLSSVSLSCGTAVSALLSHSAGVKELAAAWCQMPHAGDVAGEVGVMPRSHQWFWGSLYQLDAHRAQ